MWKVTLHPWEPYIDIPLLFVLTLAIIFSGFNQWPILLADQKTSNCVKLVHAPSLKGDDWTKYLVFLQSANQTLNVHSHSFCGLCLPDLWSRQLCLQGTQSSSLVLGTVVQYSPKWLVVTFDGLLIQSNTHSTQYSIKKVSHVFMMQLPVDWWILNLWARSF